MKTGERWVESGAGRADSRQTDTTGLDYDDVGCSGQWVGHSVPLPESRKVTVPLEVGVPSHLQKATAVQFTQPHVYYWVLTKEIWWTLRWESTAQLHHLNNLWEGGYLRLSLQKLAPTSMGTMLSSVYRHCTFSMPEGQCSNEFIHP